MDEIALLQAQLAAVQQQESALKLSDHNVIDLLMKLQQMGKVELVHTLTGRQILTPRQIEREIMEYVALHGGRLSMNELQQLINIDRSYVEKHVNQLARAQRSKKDTMAMLMGRGMELTVVNNGEEVVTTAYLDAIMEDTNTELQEKGTVTIGELAQQYGFAVEYMKEVVRTRLGSILQAHEKANVLYTKSYVASQKAQIRGVLCAITRPTFVPDLVRVYQFDEKVVDESINELLSSHVLSGVLRGREYVPLVFLDAQRESMYSFFQQNGYLEFSRASQLQVARPVDFLKKRFPEVIALKECVISQELFVQIETSIEVAVNESSFLDLRTIVPSAIHDTDLSLLLAKMPMVSTRGSTASGVQIQDVYAVSKALVDECVEKMKDDAKVRAKKAANEQQLSGRAAVSRDVQVMSTEKGNDWDEDEEDDGRRKGKRSKRAGKSSAKSAAKEDPSSMGKSKGGKSKRGKRSAADNTKSSRADELKSETVSIKPSPEEMRTLLESWIPGAESDDELLDGLVEHLEIETERVYSEALAAALSTVIRGDAASMRELRKTFEDRFDELYSLLLVLEKGYHKLALGIPQDDKDLLDQLALIEQHLLDSIGVELASLSAVFTAELHNVELDSIDKYAVGEEQVERPKELWMNELSDVNKAAFEKEIPSTISSPIVRMWVLSRAGRRSLEDFMMHVPVVIDALGIPPRKSDRKKERQIIFGYRHQTLSDYEASSNSPLEATSLLLQLFFQQTTSLPGKFPRKSLDYAPAIFASLKASVPESAICRLQQLVALAKESMNSASILSEWKKRSVDAHALVTAKDISSALDSLE